MSIDRTAPLKPISTVQPRETSDTPVANTRSTKNDRRRQYQCDIKRCTSKADATRQQ